MAREGGRGGPTGAEGETERRRRGGGGGGQLEQDRNEHIAALERWAAEMREREEKERQERQAAGAKA